MNAVRTADAAMFERSFRGKDVLQLSLLGAEQGHPRAVMVSFHVTLTGTGNSESDRIAISPRQSSCPGDCKDPTTIYLLGVHDEAQSFIQSHRDFAADASGSRALQLIQMEYASHPEVVGGPATVIRIDGTESVMEQPGVCTDGTGLPRLQAELDRSIAAVENVVVREDVEQYSKRGKELHADRVHAVVRVLSGNEEYSWNGQRTDLAKLPEANSHVAGLPTPDLPTPGLPTPGLPTPGLPTPWCGGELATMMRVTRQVLARGETNQSIDKTQGEPTLLVAFHSTESDRHWQLVLGSHTYPLAFDGRAWFSQATGELVRIRWEATDLHLPASAGITRIEWDETFSTTNISGRPFLAPSTAVYRVSYTWKVNRTDWTETRFSDFRRYGSTTDLQFEEAALR
jgi:hypothetical protein